MSKKVLNLCLLLLLFVSRPLLAQFQVLHAFYGKNIVTGDGSQPLDSVILSGSTLYGTTYYGGINNGSDYGVVFKVDTNGQNFTILHVFPTDYTQGHYPSGRLLLVGSTLYGTTQAGGASDLGTIFKVDTDGQNFAILHSFAGGALDGSGPSGGGLIQVGLTLYGLTYYGGSQNWGTIYGLSIDPDHPGFSVLHSFTGSTSAPLDAGFPAGASLAYGDGCLYGMGGNGGVYGWGAVFKMKLDGSEFSVIHSFTGGATNGSFPRGTLVLDGTHLYGMTYGGGAGDGADGYGTVFKLDTDGNSFQVLHSFMGGTTDGRWTYGSLSLSGTTLYGMTHYGGASDLGTIFSLETDGSGYTLLHSFAGGGSDGAKPYYGSLAIKDSTLYGMTNQGGGQIGVGLGCVFGFTPGADVYVTKTADSLTPAPGALVTYTVKVGNGGPRGATGVEVTDLLPPQLTYASALCSQGSYVPSTGLWTVGSLAVGAEATLTLAGYVNSSGAITNTAAKTAQTNGDPDTSNDSDSAVINTLFQKTLLPPILLSPLTNATGQPTSVTLKWQDTNTTPQEIKYKVRIKKAGGAYANYTLAAGTVQYIKSGLALGKVYYWNVQAVGNGTTTKTSVWANGGVDFKFTVAPPVTLNPPTLTLPANGAAGQPLSVTLQWNDTNASPDELQYKVRFKIAGGTYALTTLAPGTTSLPKTGLKPGKTYYWSVMAIGNGTTIKNSVWPADYHFTTGIIR